MTSRSMLHVASAFALIGCAASAHGQFNFDAAVNLAAASRPDGIAAADLDGDDDLDLAVTLDDPDRLRIFVNDGAGNYTPGPVVNLPSSSSPGDVAAGDLDGDTDIDLAVVLRDFNQILPVINSGGAFSFGTAGAIGNNARGLTIADIDDDGDLDLGIANHDDNTATVLRNGGAANFTSSTFAVGLEPRAATFGNFTGDALLDLAVTNHDSRTISVFTNTGAAFTPMITLSTGGNLRPEGIVAADLDNDGDDDLAVATDGNDVGFASIYRRTPKGFAARVDFATGGVETSAIKAVDLDCDGMRDLVTTNEDSGNISLLRNTGAAAFGPAMIRATGTHPDNVAYGDIDSDGDADVAVTNRDSNTVSILRNATCTPAVAGDINGDSVVDVNDLMLLVGAWGACGGPSCPADLTGDSIVDVNDLLLLIGNWT